jgi:Ca2+-binding EF-hand superfamily protein/CRP-like cAMP-binding protein/anti-anti-sigma regulatory factor
VELQATQIVTLARRLAERNLKLPAEGGLATAESLRYIAIDFAHVENLDYSGAIAFLDIRDMLQEAGITVLFTGLNQKVRPKLIQEGVLSSLKEGHMNEFVNLDFASEYVETMMLDRAAFVRGYWLMFDSFRKLHTQALLKATYEIFEAVLGAEVGNRLWRYAEQQQFRAGDFLCREGHFNHTLYLLQRGAVTTFAAKGGGDLAAMHAKLLLGSSSDRGAVGAGEVRLAVSGGRRDSSEMTGGSWGGGSGSKIKTKTKTKRAIRQQRELERQATQIKRKHTMGRGAFVNEECLFRDDPVQHSTIADEDCVVWAISRQSMKELEAHDPHLAAAILRNILRVSSAVRERLEREVSAIESFHNTVDAEGGGKSNLRLLSSGARDSGFGLFGGTAAGGGGSGSGTGAGGDTLSSKSLGTRVLQEIRDMHEHRANNAKDVDLIEDTLHVTGAAHSHHFHHMAIDEAIRTSVDGYQGMASSIRAGQGEKGISTSHSSRGSLSPRSPVAAAARAGSAPRHKRRFGEASPDWHDVRPHLSAAQRQDAIDCFLVHSVLQRTNTAHPDILPELILAGVAPHLVHAVAQRRAAAGDEGGAEEDGESKKVALGGGTLGATGTSARHERRDGGESLPDNAEAYRQRRCTIDVLHELKRPKSFRELGTNAEMEVGEVEAYELSLLESIMRESGDAKAIAQKFASVTSGKRSPVMTTSDGDRLQTAAEASSTATLDNSNNNKKKTGASPPSPKRNIKLGHDHRRISLEELQRAVMDLGFFPSAAEVRDMHATLGPHHHLRVGSAAFEDGADLDEFLEMITVLSLKRMTHRQLEGLHSLFVLYADKKTGTKLSREALEKLMKSLNHPEDEIELEFLMREWDLENLGFLDFDAFVSIVSHVLKSEELDQQVERDFLTLCGETNVLNPSKQQQRSAVVAADVVRTARALGVPVDHDLAEEMVFDADEDGTSQLTLDELIATIEHVHIDETIDDDDEGGGCATGANSGWFEPISPDGRSSSGLHYAPDQHPRSTVGLAADDDNNSEMSRRNSDNENAGGSSSLEGAADGVELRSPSSAALRKHGMAERRQSRIEMRRKPDATED